MKVCIHCDSHGEYCETPCFHFNRMFEEYLVIAYAAEVLQANLEPRSAWHKRCQALAANARYLSHYCKSLIQVDRMVLYEGPLTPEGWPQWVRDRAEVAVKRHARTKS